MQFRPKRVVECVTLAEVRVEEGKRRGKAFHQAEMAGRLCVSQSKVSLIESGKCDWGYFEVDAWASAYGLTRRQFVRLFSRTREQWMHRQTVAQELPLFAGHILDRPAEIVELKAGDQGAAQRPG